MVMPVFCHDQLPTPIDRKPFLLAVRREFLIAPAGECRLERLGGIVEPGMKHAAVPAACMESAVRFLFDQRDTGISIATPQVAGDIQADDASADHWEVCVPHSC